MSLGSVSSVINLVLELVIAVLSVAGNSLVIYVIWKNKSLHNVTNYFIANLAVADFLVGACAIPFAVISEIWELPHNFYGCLFLNCMVVVLTQSSIFSLLAVAIERFAAIKNPFHHQSRWTPKFAAIIVVMAWILAILIGLVPMFGWHQEKFADNIQCKFMLVMDMRYMVFFNFFAAVLPPLIAMAAIYGYIFHIVLKHTRQIADLEVIDSDSKKEKHAFRKEFKAAKPLALLILFFALSWLPLHILNTISVLCPIDCAYPFELLLTAILLSHANSAINPVLYAYANTSFRRAFCKVFNIETSETSSYYDDASVIQARRSASTANIPNNALLYPPLSVIHNKYPHSESSSLDGSHYCILPRNSIKDNVLKDAIEQSFHDNLDETRKTKNSTYLDDSKHSLSSQTKLTNQTDVNYECITERPSIGTLKDQNNDTSQSIDNKFSISSPKKKKVPTATLR